MIATSAPEPEDDHPRSRMVRVVSNASDPLPVRQRTAKEILNWMIGNAMFIGKPLPDGYVPPPGIDIEELLKQLPPRYRPKPPE